MSGETAFGVQLAAEFCAAFAVSLETSASSESLIMVLLCVWLRMRLIMYSISS